MNQYKRKGPRAFRLALFAACALAVAAGTGYWYFELRYPPMGEGPAGPDVPLAPFGQPLYEGQVMLLGIGDSVTDGYGARQGYGYFERLAANPTDEWPDMQGRNLTALFPALRASNQSISGSTSVDCLEKQLPAIDPFPDDTLGLVVLTTGGNDLIHFYGRTPPQEHAMYGATMEQAKPWIENFRSRLDQIVGETAARFPGGCYIFLANIYDPSDGEGDPTAAGLPPWPEMLEILSAYNGAIAECAANHDNVWLVDIHGAFLGHGVNCTKPWSRHYDKPDPHYWYYENLEDPNERGYDAIRRLYLLTMLKAFDERPPELR